MKIIIRNEKEEDINEMIEIYNEEVEKKIEIWKEKIVDMENRKKWMEKRKREGFKVMVEESEGKVVGYERYGKLRKLEGLRN